MSQPTIHALLIGINEYKHKPGATLKGCVFDTERVQSYLQETLASKYKINDQLLHNEAATKAGIVDAFKNHLITPAKEGDYIFFYFSGHGGQEEASHVFHPYQSDNKLQGLICHDTDDDRGTRLADKELRYLLSHFTDKKCQVIMIFDCCHSGENMRLDEIAETQDELTAKSVDNVAGVRRWKDFIFTEDERFRNFNVFEEKHLDELMPLPPVVQFAACMDFERAQENKTKARGVFTHNLLATLRESGGAISYLELQLRLQQRLKLKRWNQTPRIFTPRKHHHLMYKGFFSEAMMDQPLLATLAYDERDKKEWYINLGAIHGVKIDDPSHPPLVEVYLDTNKDPDKSITGSISKVETEMSIVKLDLPELELLKLPRTQQYEAYISGLMMQKVHIKPSAETKALPAFQAFIKQNETQLAKDLIYLNEQNPDYLLVAEKGALLIQEAKSLRPLTKAIPGQDDSSLQRAFSRFKHIGRWLYIKNLQNPHVQGLPEHPIQLTLYPSNGDSIRLDPAQAVVPLLHKHPDSEEEAPRYRFEFENTSQYELFVACFYLDELFQVDVNYLEPNVVHLKPGAKYWGINGHAVQLNLPEYVKAFKLAAEKLYLKILVSTSSFSVNRFAMASLDAPEISTRATTPEQEDEYSDRGWMRSPETQPQATGWTTQLFRFYVKNPLV